MSPSLYHKSAVVPIVCSHPTTSPTADTPVTIPGASSVPSPRLRHPPLPSSQTPVSGEGVPAGAGPARPRPVHGPAPGGAEARTATPRRCRPRQGRTTGRGRLAHLRYVRSRQVTSGQVSSRRVAHDRCCGDASLTSGRCFDDVGHCRDGYSGPSAVVTSLIITSRPRFVTIPGVGP